MTSECHDVIAYRIACHTAATKLPKCHADCPSKWPKSRVTLTPSYIQIFPRTSSPPLCCYVVSQYARLAGTRHQIFSCWWTYEQIYGYDYQENFLASYRRLQASHVTMKVRMGISCFSTSTHTKSSPPPQEISRHATLPVASFFGIG